MGVLKRRKYYRTNINLPVGMDLGVEARRQGVVRHIKNISPGGAFVEAPEYTQIGTEVLCRFILPSGTKVRAAGKVWRLSPNGMALKFDQVSPQLKDEFRYEWGEA